MWCRGGLLIRTRFLLVCLKFLMEIVSELLKIVGKVKFVLWGGGEHEKCSVSQVLHYQPARCDRHQKASQKASQNRSKNRPKSIAEVIKSRLGKRLASQATQKHIFYILLAPKRIPEVAQNRKKALTLIEGNYFWALRAAICRCGALRTRFSADLGWIWDDFGNDFR